jgi:hypothetical protein
MATTTSTPSLTAEQWEDRDYRQRAGALDDWRKSERGAADDDATEYVAKLGIDKTGSVIIMNRAHDRVLVPPPARAPLAAFALAEQSFGFTAADVRAVRDAADLTQDRNAASALRDLGHRIEAIIPPST